MSTSVRGSGGGLGRRRRFVRTRCRRSSAVGLRLGGGEVEERAAAEVGVVGTSAGAVATGSASARSGSAGRPWASGSGAPRSNSEPPPRSESSRGRGGRGLDGLGRPDAAGGRGGRRRRGHLVGLGLRFVVAVEVEQRPAAGLGRAGLLGVGAVRRCLRRHLVLGGASSPRSNSDEPPLAFAAGPTSAVSVTVSAVWVSSPGCGSALVSSLRPAAPEAAAASCGPRRGLALHRRQQHLRDVEDLDLLAGAAVGLLGGQPVGEHHPAEGAADRDLVGAGRDGLLRAVDVDPLAEVLLHPHPGPAGAAAERAFLRPLHLDVRRTRQHLRAARAAGRRPGCAGPGSRGRGR